MTTPPDPDGIELIARAVHRIDCACKTPDQHTPEVWPYYEEIAEAAYEAVATRVRAQIADDLRTVLNQRITHSHRQPGVWDPDNRPGLANTRCVECAARERLHAWLSARPAAGTDQPPDDLPTAPNLGATAADQPRTEKKP